MRQRRTIAFTWLVVLAAGPASAADGIRAELDACRVLADDAERLACYDRAAGRILAQAAHPKRPLRPRPRPRRRPPRRWLRRQLRHPPRAPRTTSAASAYSLPRRPKRQQQETRDIGELSATVTDIDTRMDGLMTITLDNGQVWRQVAPGLDVPAEDRRSNPDPARRA